MLSTNNPICIIGPDKDKRDYSLCNIRDNTYSIPYEGYGNMYSNSLKNLSDALKTYHVDADFFLFNDLLFIDDVLTYSQATYQQFSGYLRILQMHNHMLKNEYDYTHNSLLKEIDSLKITAFRMIKSMLLADIIFATPILWDSMKDIIKKELFNDKSFNSIKDKIVNLPPYVYYTNALDRFQDNKTSNILSFKRTKGKPSEPYRFIWHHRLAEEKNFDVFISFMNAFILENPDLNIELHFTGLKEKKVLNKLRGNGNIINISKIHGRLSEDEYFKLLSSIHFQILTSEAESFGVSMRDGIKCNVASIGLHSKNVKFSPYRYAFQDKYFYDNVKSAVCYVSSLLGNLDEYLLNVKHHKNIIKKEPNASEYLQIFNNSVLEVYNNKIIPPKKISGLTMDILKIIDKQKVISKIDLFKAIDWNINSNKFWSLYYYKLRTQGVQVYSKDNTVLYYKDYNDIKKYIEMPTNSEINTKFFEYGK